MENVSQGAVCTENIHSGNLFPLGKAEKPGGWGNPPFHRLSERADGGTCSFSSHWENWALGFLFPVARCQKHLFSNLDHG